MPSQPQGSSLGAPARRLILLVFVLSGAAGLIDEIVWSRQLVLVFGNTTQAVSAILTGFFGGMAIGAAIGGRLADRIGSPLRLYGIIEVVLVGIVLATPVTFGLINEVYRQAYPALEGSPQALALIRLGLSLLALGPATVLMGATLPALTKYLTSDGHLSLAFGKLYAANTIGAILGTIVAGVVLIELLGLAGALAVGAACSGLAGVVALLLDRRLEPSRPRLAEMPAPPPAGSAATTTYLPRLALAVAFISGLTSLGYQVLWTRLLSSGTGNTTYVFTVILALFLTGIAIGALIFNIIRPRLTDPARLLAATQVLVGALVILGLVAFIGRPQIIDPSDPLAPVSALFRSAMPVVLLTTIVLGITFPAAAALLPKGSSQAGEHSGRLVAVNTIGAIAGSFVVPFFLIPLVGSPRAAALLAIVNLVLGAAIALFVVRGGRRQRWPTVAVAAGTAVALVLAAASPNALVQPNAALIRSVGGDLYAVAEDEIATVEAGQIRATPELWVAGTSMTLLTVDAKLMTLLPLVARPEAEDALIVAFGMGSSFRTALIAGLRTDVVELVPSVPAMFRFYYDDAEDVVRNPMGRVIVADGRNHLELTTRMYDIIVTDPPPPIESSGASVISSLDYYEAGRDRLKPGGIMMQWVPYGQPIDEFRAHVRSFAAVYPEILIAFGPGGYGTFMLGAADPIELDPGRIRSVLERPGVLEDLTMTFDSPATTVDGWIETIVEALWIEGETVRRFAGEGPLLTDDRPYSEYFFIRRMLGSVSVPTHRGSLLEVMSAGR